MDYKQYEVSEELRPFLKCFWSLDAPISHEIVKQRILPDGCMEMIFHYGDLYYQYADDGSRITQPRCFVFGQITAPLEIEPTGVSGIIAARFHPEGFATFATMPLIEMNNKAVPLNDLFENADLLESDILSANNNEDRIKILEAFFLNTLCMPDLIDRIAKSSVEILLQHNGRMPVEVLASQLNISRRLLERKFATQIGISPKQLSKAIRLQTTIKLMNEKNYSSLTSLALENGYYDQAHFIKDFREFTGVSPKEFYSGHLKFSGLFVTED